MCLHFLTEIVYSLLDFEYSLYLSASLFSPFNWWLRWMHNIAKDSTTLVTVARQSAIFYFIHIQCSRYGKEFCKIKLIVAESLVGIVCLKPPQNKRSIEIVLWQLENFESIHLAAHDANADFTLKRTNCSYHICTSNAVFHIHLIMVWILVEQSWTFN